ncbi:unnamed protein product [Closterium sp. NIES-53]
MASLRVLAFDPEGRLVAFDTWHDDLQLYLLSDLRDSVSLFDHVSGAAPAPPATADVSTCSQWLSRDATARLAICNHLPATECAHFGEHRIAQALYDAVVARYSSPAIAAIGRLLLPYLFPELSAFATVADLVTHLRTSDARYRAAVPAEFLPTNQPPMFITLYFIVTRLPDSLRSVRDHFLTLDPTSLTADLLEQHLLAAETSAVADVGAASSSAKRRSSKGKGGRGSGGGSGGGAGGSGSGSGGSGRGGGGSGGGGGGGTGGGGGGSGGGGGGSGGSGGSGGGGTGGGRFGPRRGGPSGGRGHAEGDCYRCVPPDPGIAAAALGASASGTPPGNAPAEALRSFRLDSGASHCFFRDSTTLNPLPAPVPVKLADPSRGPVVARSSTVLPCPATPSDSLSNLHLPSFSTNLVSTAALQDAMVTTTTPGGQRVSICTCTRMGHVSTFTRRPGSSLYTLATKPPQVAASTQVSVSGQVAASCSCRLLSHQTLLWNHRLGHPSLPCLRGMHSRLLFSGLPRALPPLPPLPASPCLPCVEGRQRAAPHSSSFPPTTAPLQTLHMDVKGEVSDVLIPWIRTVRLQLRERFGQDRPVLRLHSDRGGELSSDLLRDFYRGEGITQSFTLPDSPQKNEIAERRIGLVMEVDRTSMSMRPLPIFCGHLRSDPLPGTAPVQVAVVSGDAPRAASGVATSGGAASGGAEPGGVGSEGPGTGGAEPEGVEPGGGESEGAESVGAEPRGAASSGGPAGVSPRLSSQQLREWLVRHPHRRSGAPGAGGAGDTGAGGAAVPTGAVGTGGVGFAGAGDPTEPGGAGGVGAGAGIARVGGPGAGGAGATGAGVGGIGAGDTGATGAGAVDPGAGGAGDTVRPRLYFVPLLQQVLGVPSTSLPPPFLCPPPDQSQPPLQPASPLPAPSPYTEQCGGTHTMAPCPSSVPLRVPLAAPFESSLPEVLDPESDQAHAASPTVARLLATTVTDPFIESAAAPALVAELLDFAAACRLDYATALVAESVSAIPPSIGGECALGTDVLEDRQEDFECLAAVVPRFASMLLAPEGDPDAPDIPTLRSYAEAITGPYSSKSQAAMDAKMASWKSTGTYLDEVPPSGANIVDGKWIFRTFSPTPKMTTLWVLLHVAAQRDYELHSLDFSTAFLQGSLYVWDVSCRTTLVALGFAPSTADPSLFLCTDTSLPPFYVLVYVDDLVFATADTEALTLVKSELQKRHTCTDLGPSALWLAVFTPLTTSHSLSAPPSDESVEPSGPYPELVGCLMYLMTCTRPDLAYPLSLLARYVAPGMHRKVHWDAAKWVLCYLCSTSDMRLMLGGRGLVVLTGHADASWVDDSATQRSSQGYTFSLGSSSISWRSTCSSSVLSSSCEAEIYAGAMAAQELRWLTYLLTNLGEKPRSSCT